jgi:hypothetical protein
VGKYPFNNGSRGGDSRGSGANPDAGGCIRLFEADAGVKTADVGEPIVFLLREDDVCGLWVGC